LYHYSAPLIIKQSKAKLSTLWASSDILSFWYLLLPSSNLFISFSGSFLATEQVHIPSHHTNSQTATEAFPTWVKTRHNKRNFIIILFFNLTTFKAFSCPAIFLSLSKPDDYAVSLNPKETFVTPTSLLRPETAAFSAKDVPSWPLRSWCWSSTYTAHFHY